MKFRSKYIHRKFFCPTMFQSLDREPPLKRIVLHSQYHSVMTVRGVSRIFERWGPISLGSLKKGHQILKGLSNGLGGVPVH